MNCYCKEREHDLEILAVAGFWTGARTKVVLQSFEALPLSVALE
jgi:hypothetical protein